MVSIHHTALRRGIAAVALASLGLTPVVASTSESEASAGQPAGATETDSKGTKSKLDKLSFHGYLTQAYADSTDHVVVGIPTDGTFDYRVAALQLRYQMSPRHTFAIQLSSEGRGISPSQELQDDVELDWAFFEYRFKNELSLKVGRIQIPLGIYNEIRDVGVLLPFYRVPTTFYGEEFFVSETLDGLVLGRSQLGASGWGLSWDFYVGGWDVFEARVLNEGQVDVAVGGQVWLETPLDGLRFGLGLQRSQISGLDKQLPGETTDWKEWQASLDGRFGRLLVQAERRELDFEEGGQVTGYGLLGIDATNRLGLFAQYEWSDFDWPGGPFGILPIDLVRDLAVGARYSFSPQVVAKLEYHWYEGFTVEDRPQDFFSRFLANDPYESEYGIVSLAVSF